MVSRMIKIIFILLIVPLLFGCDSKVNQKIDYPYETLNIVSSKKNNTMSVIVIKTGIKGGTTVPFEYEFYFSKDDKSLSKNKLFLSVRGLESYKIKWTSVNTIDLEVDATRVKKFQSDILLQNNKISDLYYVRKFNFHKIE